MVAVSGVAVAQTSGATSQASSAASSAATKKFYDAYALVAPNYLFSPATLGRLPVSRVVYMGDWREKKKAIDQEINEQRKAGNMDAGKGKPDLSFFPPILIPVKGSIIEETVNADGTHRTLIKGSSIPYAIFYSERPLKGIPDQPLSLLGEHIQTLKVATNGQGLIYSPLRQMAEVPLNGRLMKVPEFNDVTMQPNDFKYFFMNKFHFKELDNMFPERKPGATAGQVAGSPATAAANRTGNRTANRTGNRTANRTAPTQRRTQGSGSTVRFGGASQVKGGNGKQGAASTFASGRLNSGIQNTAQKQQGGKSLKSGFRTTEGRGSRFGKGSLKGRK